MQSSLHYKGMVVKAVIFDLDGTLLLHKLELYEARREFLKRLEEELQINTDPFLDLPAAHILNELSEEDRIIAFRILGEVFEPFEMSAAEIAELREGVREALEFLKSHGIKLAIATNNSRESVRLCLKKVMIDSCFDVIVTRDDVADLKPNGKMILEAVRRLGLKVDEVVHVGDTAHDILAAREAGVTSIAVTGGAHDRRLLESSNPDYIVNNFTEVLRVIEELF